MRCKVCNAYIPEGAIHCLECGTELDETIVCQKCGTRLSIKATFCTKCGSSVTMPFRSIPQSEHGVQAPGPSATGFHTCFRCGLKVSDGVKYCPNCGTSHDWISEETVKASVSKTPPTSSVMTPVSTPGVRECPRCGTALRGTGRFCYICGRFQKSDIDDVVCPSCGATNILRYARCQYCGDELPLPPKPLI